MTDSEQIVLRIKEVLPALREKYGVTSLGIFGSYVRDDQSRGSDVDILVEFQEPISLFRFMTMEYELEDLIGRKVDLVMKTSLKPAIGRHVLSEVVYL
ncbi:MAG: nucleotidyltransferase family protein [Desulfomonilaceae bacterium]